MKHSSWISPMLLTITPQRVIHLTISLLQFVSVGLGCFALGLQNSWGNDAPPDSVPRYRAIVEDVRAFPRENFTQGLEISEGKLYVSSGLYGQSAVRVYDWGDMTLAREAALAPRFFAEGLTRIEDRLYVLTWREGRLLILDPSSLEIRAAMSYQGEGWGLTHHSHSLWLSDGSDRLIRIDLPKEASQEIAQEKAAQNEPTVSVIRVTLDGKPLRRLNELEWVDGEIWANIWQQDTIARIDPSSGKVVGLIDASKLLQPEDRLRDTDVLNGIARDPETGKIWVTGKRWPKIFQILLEATD